jgi:hypothetical protein
VKVLESLWQSVVLTPQTKVLLPLPLVQGVIAISAALSSTQLLASHPSSHTQLVPYRLCNIQHTPRSSSSYPCNSLSSPSRLHNTAHRPNRTNRCHNMLTPVR